jgi:RND family efflux transporter MFP subunit
LVLAILVLTGAACRDDSAAGGPPPAAPVPVGVQVLEEHPVARSSEFVALLRSRRSAELRPQVDGIITRILVNSGDRVAAGRPLLRIDASKQRAALESDQASRIAQEAAVQYAQQQYDRAQQLLEAGAISRQEFEQAQTNLETSQAALGALKAREQESRVELDYYQVTAPTAGIVGDIPVREGDRVTTSTVLTTVDENAGLEAYIRIPVERAPEVRVGLPVRLVDAQGALIAETRIAFVSPQVDDRTQSILVKAPVPQGKGLRTEQFVRARVVWRDEPGLTVPAVAVARINGQYFAYVAAPEGDGFVARQKAVQLGELVGNDYLVLSGLDAGERLIVSGVQKVGDGSPVQPET